MEHQGREWEFVEKLQQIQQAGEDLCVTVIKGFKAGKQGPPINDYEGARHCKGKVKDFDNGVLTLEGVPHYFDFETAGVCNLCTGSGGSLLTIRAKYVTKIN